MKIYNRRGFAAGLFMITLGVINLAADFWRGDFGLRDGILAAALFFFGGRAHPPQLLPCLFPGG